MIVGSITKASNKRNSYQRLSLKLISMNLSQTLTQILSNFNSTYDAAQEISLQSGDTLGTIHKRLSQWLKKDPETWVKINQTLNCLGYKLEIKKMQYIEVNGEKIEILEVVQEDAKNEAFLVTTVDQTQWVDSKEIKKED